MYIGIVVCIAVVSLIITRKRSKTEGDMKFIEFVTPTAIALAGLVIPDAGIKVIMPDVEK